MSTPFLLALLLVAALPGVRTLSRRPVWNEMRARPFPAVFAALAAAWLAWGAWHLHRRDPVVLPLATGGLLGTGAIARVRARPGFGRSRGLPPGSLGLGRSLDALSDPDFYTSCAARWGPVFKMAQFHRPVACITDLPLGLELLEREREALGAPRLPFGRVSPGHHIAFLEDERHPRHRAILCAALDGRAGRDVGMSSTPLEAARDTVAESIREGLRALAGADRGEGADPADPLSRIAYAAMLRVVCGGPIDAAELDALRAGFRALGRPRPFSGDRPEARAEPFGRLLEWAHRHAAEIRDGMAAGRAVAPSVLADILRADPARVEDRILLGDLLLIVHVTFGNVRGVLGWVLKEALDHPEHLDALRGAGPVTSVVPGTSAPDIRERARPFVYETLRLHQSEFFYRAVLRPIEVGGFRVPRRWLVRVCVREAHRDPAVFEDPEAFRPDRFEQTRYDDTVFRPFSDGTHSAFGAELAMMIAEVFLIELANGFEATATRDGPVERALNRHWSHWRPSSRLRVALRPRTDARGEPSRVR